MSDPVTNVEIEDVLASVRRLIVDGGPPPLRTAEAAGEEASVQAAPAQERLVLTPALRVVEPRVPLSGGPAGDGKAAVGRPDGGTARGKPAAGGTATAADGLVPRAGSVQAMLAGRHRSRLAGNAAEAPGRAGAGEDVTPVFRSRQGALSVPDKGMAPVGEPPFRHATATEQGPGQAHEAKGLVGSATVRSGQAAGSDDGAALRALAARIGADEATLRRIVSEVIQHELQGALGERITHNLRKLVRREIARTLAEDEDL